MAKDVIHEGKRRFWSGKVDTLCGQVYSPSSEPEGGLFTSINCPACKAAYKAGKRL